MPRIRIACAVPEVQLCDCQTNTERICRYIQDAGHCHMVVFPELALTGATCGDLFFQKTLLRGVGEALVQILLHSKNFPNLYIALGAPLMIAGRRYNCGLLLQNGKLLGIVPKTELPLQQKRWFRDDLSLSQTVAPQDIGLAGSDPIPVGADLVFDLDGVRVALLIGEGRSQIPDGDVLLHLSAAPAFAGCQTAYRRLAETISKGRVYAYAGAGSAESTQNGVYSGICMIGCDGEVLQNDRIAPTDCLLVRQVQVPERNGQRCSGACLDIGPMEVKRPYLPQEDPEGYALSVFSIQAAALARRLQTVRARPVIGVSGGLDSTLALLVAAEAVHLLGRQACDVVGITMPCFGTTDRTHNNAIRLMELLGITAREIHIQAAVKQHFTDIGHRGDRDTTFENAQARERTQVLMDYAGMVGGIVVGTGDLSEIALGWCTYNGDHMSMYSVNGSVVKSLIPYVLRAVATLPRYQAAAPVLEDVIATPISPELLPPDGEGRIAQQTEDLVGPYELHDFFLVKLLREHLDPQEIYTLACKAFEGEYDKPVIGKWLSVFYRRFFTQQFKRSCMPEGVKVSDLSLSPRGDFSMPSDASAALWLRVLQGLQG